MESTYYTPTIEEFHVGFEYEAESTCYPDKNNWHPETFYINDSHLKLVNRNTLYENKVRVKHLDREDIESLGWKFSSEPDNERAYIFSLNGNYLQYWYNSFAVTIKSMAGPEVYAITIKNKSELAKLMQQLNIKTE